MGCIVRVLGIFLALGFLSICLRACASYAQTCIEQTGNAECEP